MKSDSGQTAKPGGIVGATTPTPMRLYRRTDEFVVALLLCRARLVHPAGAVSPPPISKLTREILEVTNSWHLVFAYEENEDTRGRLQRRVHGHLETLRRRVVRSGLADCEAGLSLPQLAEVLIDTGAVRRQDLDLLQKASWLRQQAQLWWEL